MKRHIAEIAADLDALISQDFDYAITGARGWKRLEELCEEMRAGSDPATSASVMFRTMERLDGVELGSPGPFVHAIECWPGNYEKLLAESIRRKPTLLSVWMANRILNAEPSDAASWMTLLRNVADSQTASEEVKAVAARFIEYQSQINSNVEH